MRLLYRKYLLKKKKKTHFLENTDLSRLLIFLPLVKNRVYNSLSIESNG